MASVGDHLEGPGGGYALVEELGRGAFGAVFRARQTGSGADVAVKVLRLGQVQTWKAWELFEREAAALRSIRHRNIPRYIDSFSVGDASNPGLALVQEFVDGRSLEAIRQAGERLPPKAMLRWFTDMLDVLAYLHALSPPVIHRDITPKNIVLRADGRAFLVDFGSVQAALRGESSISETATGTFGYAPLEQFVGRSGPATDLYSLAMTYVAVASGREPAALPFRHNRVIVGEALRGEAGLVDVLERMTEPTVELRLGDARQALNEVRALRQKRAVRAVESSPEAAKADPAPLPRASAPHRERQALAPLDALFDESIELAGRDRTAVSWSQEPIPRPAPDRSVWGLRHPVGAGFQSLGLLSLVLAPFPMLLMPTGLPFADALSMTASFIGAAVIAIVASWLVRRRTSWLYRYGHVAAGQVELASWDPSYQRAGEHPRVLDYQFEVSGCTYSGRCQTLEFEAQHTRERDRVTVLYDPTDPGRSTLVFGP